MYLPSKCSLGCSEMLRSSDTDRVFKHLQFISLPIGQICNLKKCWFSYYKASQAVNCYMNRERLLCTYLCGGHSGLPTTSEFRQIIFQTISGSGVPDHRRYLVFRFFLLSVYRRVEVLTVCVLTQA